MVKVKEEAIRGIGVSHGVAIGTLALFSHEESEIVERPLNESEIPAEERRYERALTSTRQDIKRLKKQFEMDGLQEAAAILETHLQIIDDPLITEEIKSNIGALKRNPEYVFDLFIARYQKRFEKIKDPFFRERGRDLSDVSRRVLSYLRESGRKTLASLTEKTILYCHEIAASDVAEANPKHVLAIVTDVGGSTSHAAIIAKAKGIPYIANVSLAMVQSGFGCEAIVDGRTGDVILHPSEKTLDRYRLIEARIRSIYLDLEQHCSLSSETCDGYPVRLSANIEMVSEIDQLHKYGGSGVGLFRSEYIFLSKQCFPSEEEQYLIYSRIVERMKGLPIVIRTFDVGGDKLIVEQQASHKGNPYLGCRAIRFLLKERDIFKAQLRAILRAAENGKVSILFPMVSDLSELMEAKEIIAEVQDELWPGKRKIDPKVRIGCMIEVPSAALIADLLARECDFLAIGTNDLVQYLLAVDRCNQAINKLYTPMHPALIRLIKLVVTQASELNVPVSVCGEIAGDPRFTPLLIGLGVHELSVSLRNYPLIKQAIRRTSIIRAHELADEVVGLTTPDEIREALTREYKRIMPEDCHDLTLN